jgi:hypothetical protein
MERLAQVVEAYGGCLEIFVDGVEFAAMELVSEYAETIAAVKQQLADMVRRGHRLQLHVHPQWNDAQFSGQDWILYTASWRIGQMRSDQLIRVLASAHNWIRSAVRDVSPSYSCSVFRAGGWCIQPSDGVVPALRSLGLVADSSVAPGMASKEPLSWYDFRKCPRASWWRVDLEVDNEGNGDFLEIPIATGRVNPLTHLLTRVRRSQQGEFAPGCTGTYLSRRSGAKRFLRVLEAARGARWAMLVYCGLRSDLLVGVVEDVLRRFGDQETSVPVVAIGHTKNFSKTAEQEMTKFLKWVADTDVIELGSYASWQKLISNTADALAPMSQEVSTR